MKKILKLADAISQITEEKNTAINEINKELQPLVKKKIEELRGENFDKAFDLWLKYAIKKTYGWIIHVTVKGKDIWDFIDLGQPIREKFYTINEILMNLGEHDLSKDILLEYKKILMDKNIGSVPFDW